MGRDREDGPGVESWIAAAAIAGALTLGVHAGPLAPRREPRATFEDVKAIVRARYVKPLDERVLEWRGVKGLVSSLDPYTAFFPPEEAREFLEDAEGELSGIGIELTVEKGHLTVIAPLEDTPAWEAGILPGDRIIEIDGQARDWQSAAEAARMIKGLAGTPVKLTIVHEGGTRPREVTVVRRRFNVPSVKRPRLLEGGIGYLRVPQFTPRATDEVRAAVESLLARGMRALVLDLRLNPGGHLDSALGVADLFLDSGAILRTESRDETGVRTTVYDAQEPGTFPPFPLAVLVNGGSASAAEIVAGALKDAGRAVVVGTRTHGKGSVQALIRLRADERGEGTALLKLTTARFFTRSGRQIQRESGAGEADAWGIDPDERVALDQDPKVAAERLREIFNRRAALDAHDAGAGAGDAGNGVADAPEDGQLEAAVAALAERLREEGGRGTDTK